MEREHDSERERTSERERERERERLGGGMWGRKEGGGRERGAVRRRQRRATKTQQERGNGSWNNGQKSFYGLYLQGFYFLMYKELSKRERL